MTYIKQLDCIRAFAVFVVIVSHWIPKYTYTFVELGGLGVDIFFVLSGFLITKILLLQKNKIEDKNQSQSKIKAIWKFIVRRALRIFPIYYLVLLVLYFGYKLLPNPIPQDWPYYVTYTQNILYYIRGSLAGGKVGHTWSLAVEEQFYLFWPWLLLYIHQKHVKTVLVTGIFVGVVISLLFPILFPNKGAIIFMLPTCLQSFCIGGLLSYYTIYKFDWVKNKYIYIKQIAIVSILCYIVIKIFFPVFHSLDRTIHSLCALWLISFVIFDKYDSNSVVNNKYFISFGKVSYGVYIYHHFIPVSFNAILHFLLKHNIFVSPLYFIQNNTFIFFLMSSLILLGVSYFSYYFIESPFLKLKKYFE